MFPLFRSPALLRACLLFLLAAIAACASPPPKDPLQIRLPELTSEERSFLSAGAMKSPPVISVIRSLPAEFREISSERLAWRKDDNGWHARIRVESPGASEITLAICADPAGTTVNISLEETGPANILTNLELVEEKCEKVNQYWLPRLRRSSATLWLSASGDEPPEDFSITLVEVRHRR